MKTKAAVLFETHKPFEIIELELDGFGLRFQNWRASGEDQSSGLHVPFLPHIARSCRLLILSCDEADPMSPGQGSQASPSDLWMFAVMPPSEAQVAEDCAKYGGGSGARSPGR